MCEICKRVEFNTDDPRDRALLVEKPSLMSYGKHGIFINGPEMLFLQYYVGYFIVLSKTPISFCPVCGDKLEEGK